MAQRNKTQFKILVLFMYDFFIIQHNTVVLL